MQPHLVALIVLQVISALEVLPNRYVQVASTAKYRVLYAPTALLVKHLPLVLLPVVHALLVHTALRQSRVLSGLRYVYRVLQVPIVQVEQIKYLVQ